MRSVFAWGAVAAWSMVLTACCCPNPCGPRVCRPVCCPPPSTATAAASPAPKGGALLGDTYAFRPSPLHAGTWTWTRPGVDLRAYDDLLIEPVRAEPAAGAAFAALPAAEQAAAAQALHAALLRAVAPYYDVVQTPGAHTLRVRVALTSVPAADGSGAAGVEAELLDGQSEQRLVAALGTLAPEAWAAPAGGDASTAAERSHRAWAARLLRYLDTHVR